MFYNEDCVEGAKRHIPDDSIDLIITDPPYGISGHTMHKHYNRNEANVIDGYIEVPTSEYEGFTNRWIQQAERVLKPGASMYVVSGYTNLRHVLNALSKTSLQEVNHIIWKYNFGVYTRRKYVSSHYHILYYVKPGKRYVFNTYSRYADCEKDESGRALNYLDREDVWVINREYKPGEVKNKNELPVGLLAKMILYSSNENDLICDFFLGGFSTAKVAIALNRRATGFELSANAFDYQISQMRLIQPGSLLAKMRRPPANVFSRSGDKVTREEVLKIQQDFIELKSRGYTKKHAIEEICKHSGRGYWAILRIVDGTTNKSQGICKSQQQRLQY